MSASIDFVLTRRHPFNPENPTDQLALANRIACIFYGKDHINSPAELSDDGRKINIHPSTNHHWLILPGNNGLDNEHFRLLSRYDSEELLKAVVLILQNYF